MTVANGCKKIEFGRVLKIPTTLGDHHASGVDPSILKPPVQGDVTFNVSSNNKSKNLLQECIDVVGFEDASQLLST